MGISGRGSLLRHIAQAQQHHQSHLAVSRKLTQRPAAADDRSYFNYFKGHMAVLASCRATDLNALEGARAARPQASGEPGSSVVLLGPHPHARDVVAHIAATNAKTRRR